MGWRIARAIAARFEQRRRAGEFQREGKGGKGKDGQRQKNHGSAFGRFKQAFNLAQAIVLASEKYDSDIHLNIGSGEELSIRELAFKVAAATGFTGEIEWDLNKPDGTPRKFLDISRIQSLGWAPTIKLDEGIASTVAWYREANARGEVRK